MTVRSSSTSNLNPPSLKTANKEFTIRKSHLGQVKALEPTGNLNETLGLKLLHDILVIKERNIANKLDQRRAIAMIIQAAAITWLIHVLDTALASREVRTPLMAVRQFE